MPTSDVLVSFSARVFAKLKDGDYLTIRQGRTRERAELARDGDGNPCRFGPDGRRETRTKDGVTIIDVDDEPRDDDDLDELFSDADEMSLALRDVVEGLGSRSNDPCWVEVFHKGARRPHDRVTIDTFEHAPEDRNDADGMDAVIRGAVKTGASVDSLALVKLSLGMGQQAIAIAKEARTLLADTRKAQQREAESNAEVAKLAAREEFETRAAGLLDGEARAQRSHEATMKFFDLVAPHLGPLAARFVGGPSEPAKPTAPPTPDGAPGWSTLPGAPEVAAAADDPANLPRSLDLVFHLLERAGSTPETARLILAEQPRFFAAIAALQRVAASTPNPGASP